MDVIVITCTNYTTNLTLSFFMSSAQNAFVTLATTDEYAIGALNLAQSLRNVGTSADLVILVTSGVSAQIR